MKSSRIDWNVQILYKRFWFFSSLSSAFQKCSSSLNLIPALSELDNLENSLSIKTTFCCFLLPRILPFYCSIKTFKSALSRANCQVQISLVCFITCLFSQLAFSALEIILERWGSASFAFWLWKQLSLMRLNYGPLNPVDSRQKRWQIFNFVYAKIFLSLLNLWHLIN